MSIQNHTLFSIVWSGRGYFKSIYINFEKLGDWQNIRVTSPISVRIEPGGGGGGQLCCFLPGCVSIKLKEMGPF